MNNWLRKFVVSVAVTAIAALSLLPAADARRVMFSKGYSGAPYTFNLKTSNTTHLRAAWAGHTGNVLLPVVGDSTVAGQSFGVGTAQAQNSWPMQMAPLLRAAGINAGANNYFSDRGSWGLGQTFANMLTGDGRLQGTGAMALGATKTPGGNALQSAAAGSVIFTPTDNVDTAIIWWKDTSSGRNFNWQVNGGATTEIDSTGVVSLARNTIALGTAGVKAITQNWVLGTITLVGISAYNSTLGQELSILDWGICGVTSTGLNDNTDAAYGRLQTITTVQPPGVFYEAGLINDWRTSIAVATSKANMITMVTTIKNAGGDPILVAPVYDNGSTGLTANQNAYVAAMYQVAAEYNVPLVDIRLKWLSYANAVANGWQTNSDNVHPTTAGYADIAAVMANVVKAIINNTFASLDDKDAPLSPANDNYPPLYSDRRMAA